MPQTEKNPRAYFVGAGLHTALGRDLKQNLAALRLPIAAPQAAYLQFANQEITLPYYLLADEPLEDWEHRLYRILVGPIEEALQAAQLSTAQRRELSLFVGTSSSDVSVVEACFKRDLKISAAAQPLMESSSLGNVALWIMEHFGFRGADFSINTACTASANALIQANAMISSGCIERALVIGLEHCNSVTALGFNGLQLLTTEGMRPFDSRRKGLVLGEGCSALILDTEQRTEANFFLRGAATLCDTHSISATNPDGSTIQRVMELALAAADLSSQDIDAIKVHGTASLLNDEAEVAGMRRVFADLPPLCAIKPRIGHTLGACGLNELLLMCAAAEQGWLPGTPGVCATKSDLGVVLNQEPLTMTLEHLMLNYFGFGGNNTSLIVSRD